MELKAISKNIGHLIPSSTQAAVKQRDHTLTIPFILTKDLKFTAFSIYSL